VRFNMRECRVGQPAGIRTSGCQRWQHKFLPGISIARLNAFTKARAAFRKDHTMTKTSQILFITTVFMLVAGLNGYGQNAEDFVRREGGRLVAGRERTPVFLRGINLDYEFLITNDGEIIMDDPDDRGRPMFDRFAESDYQRIANMCMNAIRLGLNYRLFEDNANPFVYKDEVWPWLDRQIQWAKNQGLYLILDMHVPPGGLQPSGGGGASQWDDPIKQQRFKALWYAIAERYKDETTIPITCPFLSANLRPRCRPSKTKKAASAIWRTCWICSCNTR
jgi:hypothetical protein